MQITYPDDEGVEVKAMRIQQGVTDGNTAQITFTYYRTYENDAKDEVKLADDADVTLVTGTLRNRIGNFLKGK
ncbi:uncharacterized protein LOC111060425 [Nilaparvata lugens]|uniref:uncharacterized protein LOC111060425 n=1 Tax=Nilaparvata lugens TaxID=108931 RepID=UPI00193CD70F|nr:uncharacterized protein LOC111060425 [Nilaparvata lugens]XP_039294406.1 uncharacterized protein LOC111060425 [Nilaparvata lugens]